MTKAKRKEVADLEGTKLEPKANKMKPIEKPVRKLNLKRFKQAEFHRRYFHITPTETETIEDTLKAEYWANVAEQIDISDRIEALWEDSSKFAEYVVLDKGAAWLRVALINKANLTKSKQSSAPELPDEFKISHSGHQDKYIVVRMSDGVRVSQGHQTQESAEKWLVEHRQAI
jgi:hypothetical protein